MIGDGLGGDKEMIPLAHRIETSSDAKTPYQTLMEKKKKN
jgi:hypothetical protein